MPGVFWGEPFANEYMTKVPAAISANNFRPAAIGIGYTKYGAGDLIVKTGPAATGIEFVFGIV